jgi:quinol monooxygenase YgiN
MSAPGQIVVIARWQIDAQRVAELLDLVTELRQHSLAEQGCLSYEVFRSTDDPGSLLLLERYRDDTAIDAHRNSSHYRELVVEHILPLLSNRQVELLRT